MNFNKYTKMLVLGLLSIMIIAGCSKKESTQDEPTTGNNDQQQESQDGQASGGGGENSTNNEDQGSDSNQNNSDGEQKKKSVVNNEAGKVESGESKTKVTDDEEVTFTLEKEATELVGAYIMRVILDTDQDENYTVIVDGKEMVYRADKDIFVEVFVTDKSAEHFIKETVIKKK